MQVSVENISELGRRIKVTVPAERVEQEFTARIKRLGGQVKIPGFRPGKVPVKVLEKKYGGQVMGEIAGDLIQSTFQEAVGQKSLRPAGGPKIDPGTPQRGKEFEYTAEFEVYPDLKNINISGVKIKKPTCDVSSEDVDNTIDTLRKQRVSWSVVERACKKGDQLEIDFVGKIDGEKFDGGTATAFKLELGSGSFIAGFEDGLLGASANEERNIDIAFPEDYAAAHLQGKAAVFEVTVKSVSEGLLPEIDDEFVKSLGIKSGDIDDFRKDVKKNLERETRQRLRALLRNRVVDALIANNKLEVPQALIDEEVKRMQKAASANKQPVMEATDADRDLARRRVVTGLLFAEVMDAAGITADGEKVSTQIDELSSEYDNPEEYKKWFYSDPSRLREIEGLALEELVVESLLAKAKVSDEVIAFKELSSSAMI